MRLAQHALDGGERTQMRLEEFRLAHALWAGDDSLVLIHTLLVIETRKAVLLLRLSR